MISPGIVELLTDSTMNCLPLSMYVISDPVVRADHSAYRTDGRRLWKLRRDRHAALGRATRRWRRALRQQSGGDQQRGANTIAAADLMMRRTTRPTAAAAASSSC
jgi:hypothetical protein